MNHLFYKSGYNNSSHYSFLFVLTFVLMFNGCSTVNSGASTKRIDGRCDYVSFNSLNALYLANSYSDMLFEGLRRNDTSSVTCMKLRIEKSFYFMYMQHKLKYIDDHTWEAIRLNIHSFKEHNILNLRDPLDILDSNGNHRFSPADRQKIIFQFAFIFKLPEQSISDIFEQYPLESKAFYETISRPPSQ